VAPFEWSILNRLIPKNLQIPSGMFRLGGIMKTSKYEEYRLYAEHCLSLVRIATTREARVIQREMAAEWFKLADMFCTP
jgi:hypothetical protein